MALVSKVYSQQRLVAEEIDTPPKAKKRRVLEETQEKSAEPEVLGEGQMVNTEPAKAAVTEVDVKENTCEEQCTEIIEEAEEVFPVKILEAHVRNRGGRRESRYLVMWNKTEYESQWFSKNVLMSEYPELLEKFEGGPSPENVLPLSDVGNKLNSETRQNHPVENVGPSHTPTETAKGEELPVPDVENVERVKTPYQDELLHYLTPEGFNGAMVNNVKLIRSKFVAIVTWPDGTVRHIDVEKFRRGYGTGFYHLTDAMIDFYESSYLKG